MYFTAFFLIYNKYINILNIVYNINILHNKHKIIYNYILYNIYLYKYMKYNKYIHITYKYIFI